MRRRWVMQGVLCGVLAAALGVAALVSRRAGPKQVELGNIVTIDDLTIPWLVGWSLERNDEGLLLEETRGNSLRRQLRIRHSRAAGFVSPLEHLVRAGEIAESEAKAAGMVSIGGWPGVLVLQRRSGAGELRRRLLACAVVDADVIVLRLDGDDQELLRRFGKEVKVAELGEVKVGGEIQLRDGIQLRVDRFVHVQQGDPLRVGRRLVHADKKAWMGADVTPCVVRVGEEAEELVAMMRLRDPKFVAQKMKKVGDRMWVCEREDSSRFGGMAALRVAMDGQGVLVEFRWDSLGPEMQNGFEELSRLQRSILEQIRFEQSIDLQGLVDRGSAAIKALPADLDRAGFSNAGEWEWLDEISSRTLPLKVPAAGKSDGVDPPANFVPGRMLPVVLGQLPLEAMIVRTDWMPGMEAVAERPILLRLEPAFDMPRTLPGVVDPMRCWSVEVNGSGESSRWYLDESGKVQVIVFAGKRLLRRKE